MKRTITDFFKTSRPERAITESVIYKCSSMAAVDKSTSDESGKSRSVSSASVVPEIKHPKIDTDQVILLSILSVTISLNLSEKKRDLTPTPQHKISHSLLYKRTHMIWQAFKLYNHMDPLFYHIYRNCLLQKSNKVKTHPEYDFICNFFLSKIK